MPARPGLELPAEWSSISIASGGGDAEDEGYRAIPLVEVPRTSVVDDLKVPSPVVAEPSDESELPLMAGPDNPLEAESSLARQSGSAVARRALVRRARPVVPRWSRSVVHR